MSDIEERQTEEMADALDALRGQYPDIPVDLADELRALSEKFRAARDGELRRQGMRVIGLTHVSIRNAIDDLAGRVAGVHEDLIGLHGEQDLAADKVVAALVLLNAAARLTRLETDVQELRTRGGP